MSAAPAPKGKSAGPAPVSTPENEAITRIAALQKDFERLEGEVKTLRGRLTNLKAETLDRLRNENIRLRVRVAKLERAVLALYDDLEQPRTPEDMRTQLECLKAATVDYCAKQGINPEIWKSIVS